MHSIAWWYFEFLADGVLSFPELEVIIITIIIIFWGAMIIHPWNLSMYYTKGFEICLILPDKMRKCGIFGNWEWWTFCPSNLNKLSFLKYKLSPAFYTENEKQL